MIGFSSEVLYKKGLKSDKNCGIIILALLHSLKNVNFQDEARRFVRYSSVSAYNNMSERCADSMSIWDVFSKISSENKPSGKPEFIVAGLGNPGIKYEGTRHNAGYMAADRLAEKYNFTISVHKFRSLVGDVSIAGKRCLVIKPETFMNNSGEAIEAAMSFYKIPTENVLVIFDDISLPPGSIRIRRKGSAGGHNGIKSIIAMCGGENFPRIKLGVGMKPRADYDLAAWVLGKFDGEQKSAFDSKLNDVCSAVELIVGGRIDEAMNLFNRQNIKGA